MMGVSFKMALEPGHQQSDGSNKQDDELSDSPVSQMELLDVSSNEHAPGASSDCSRGRRKTTQCQVQGCTADLLAEGKPYCIKKRLCPEHMRADAVLRNDHGDQEWRFCFQCGKLEPLSLFDGNKRSCRVRLQKRRQPLKRSSTWHANSFDAAQRLQSNMQNMMFDEWSELQESKATWPEDVDDKTHLHMQLQQHQLMLQQKKKKKLLQEYYVLQGVEGGAEDATLQQQQQLLAAKAAAAAAPADVMVLMPDAAQARRPRRAQRAATLGYGGMQDRLAACQPAHTSAVPGLMGMTPGASSGPAAAAAVGAAVTPGMTGSAGQGLLMSSQLPALTHPLQQTASSEAAAVASMPPLQPTVSSAAAATGIAAVPASSAVSWPGAAHISGTAAQAVAQQHMAVQTAANAVAGVDYTEQDLDACLDQMLQEFAMMDEIGGLDGMDVDAGGLQAGVLGAAPVTANSSCNAMHADANGMRAPQLGTLQHMNSVASSSSISAATLAGQLAALPQQQQQQQPQPGMLFPSHQVPGTVASGLVSNGSTPLQHALPANAAPVSIAAMHNVLPYHHHQQQQDQQHNLQLLKQDIVLEQQRLLKLIRQQQQHLQLLQQQQLLTSAMVSRKTPATNTSCNGVTNSQHPTSGVDAVQGTLDQRCNAMQLLLLQTRRLMQDIRGTTQTGASEGIPPTWDT